MLLRFYYYPVLLISINRNQRCTFSDYATYYNCKAETERLIRHLGKLMEEWTVLLLFILSKFLELINVNDNNYHY